MLPNLKERTLLFRRWWFRLDRSGNRMTPGQDVAMSNQFGTSRPEMIIGSRSPRLDFDEKNSPDDPQTS
jgi:hypothetical protein